MKANVRQYAESLTAAEAAGEKNARDLVKGLMSILRKKRSLPLAKKILTHLQAVEAESKGVVEVIIETAHKVDAATHKRLTAEAEKMFPDKKIHAEFQVREELGSGFRIRSKEKELDQSLATNLKKLRNQLTRP